MLTIYQLDIERPSLVRDSDNDTLSHSSFSSDKEEPAALCDHLPHPMPNPIPNRMPICMALAKVSQCSDIPTTYDAYAECMQNQLQEFGCTLSSNGRSKVSINEVFDHLDVPYYPKTSLDGVAHFIHYSSPLLTPDTLRDEVFRIAKEQMSKVC
jgi:hypothetical protein